MPSIWTTSDFHSESVANWAQLAVGQFHGLLRFPQAKIANDVICRAKGSSRYSIARAFWRKKTVPLRDEELAEVFQRFKVFGTLFKGECGSGAV